LNISETTRDRAIVTITSIGSRTRFIGWWYFQWPWRTPNPVFKVTAFLCRISEKTARLKDKVVIAQDEKYLTYGMVLCFMHHHWPLSASRRFVIIRWASCFCSVSMSKIGGS